MADYIKVKKSFFQILTEMLLIVFSVFLGLYFTNWLEEQKETKKTEYALRAINDEIKWNYEMLGGRVKYYKEVIKEMDTLGINTQNPNPSTKMTKWKGLMPPLLKDGAYQTAISSQLFSNIDFKTAEQISFVYSFQSFYMRGLQKVMDNFLDYKVDTKLKMKHYTQELAGIGSELIMAYSELSVKLDSVLIKSKE